MCQILKLSRTSIYYQRKATKDETILEKQIITIFQASKNNYGSRKIKVELSKLNMMASKRKIRQIMNLNGLVSNYTIKQYKRDKINSNHDLIENTLNRQFTQKNELAAVVSDLTYVNVNGKWHYICLIIDLYNREIIGYAAGKNKSANLVYKAFTTIKKDLSKMKLFHTDRGNEFKNKVIDEVLKAFRIKRSLSNPGTPYDNAVAEATYKIIKTEFAYHKIFKSFEELEMKLFDYVNWYNKIRIHGSLNYLSPIKFKELSLQKLY